VSQRKYVFRRHAVERMAERNISRADVEAIVETGEVIRAYPDDTPYPSRLMLGWRAQRPLHVVAADNDSTSETYIITVYEPDPDVWDEDFRSKRT
jgi:hypothetical protein